MARYDRLREMMGIGQDDTSDMIASDLDKDVIPMDKILEERSSLLDPDMVADAVVADDVKAAKAAQEKKNAALMSGLGQMIKGFGTLGGANVDYSALKNFKLKDPGDSGAGKAALENAKKLTPRSVMDRFRG